MPGQNMKGLGSEVATYHKYVDNLLLHNPDPSASDFQPLDQRFHRDFADYDRQVRL